MKTLSWRTLNDQISAMSEQEVLDLLTAERKGEKRLSILQRLHQRYNSMRVSRERIELLQEAKKP